LLCHEYTCTLCEKIYDSKASVRAHSGGNVFLVHEKLGFVFAN